MPLRPSPSLTIHTHTPLSIFLRLTHRDLLKGENGAQSHGCEYGRMACHEGKLW